MIEIEDYDLERFPHIHHWCDRGIVFATIMAGTHINTAMYEAMGLAITLGKTVRFEFNDRLHIVRLERG